MRNIFKKKEDKFVLTEEYSTIVTTAALFFYTLDKFVETENLWMGRVLESGAWLLLIRVFFRNGVKKRELQL